MAFLREIGRRIGAAVATALLCALLLSLDRVGHVPRVVLAALLAFAVLSALRPAVALMTLAAIVPIATWIGRWWDPSVAWPETLVVAFAAGYLARGVARGPLSSNDLDRPLAIAATVIFGSLAVQLLVDGWRIGDEALRASLWDLFRTSYFLPSAAGDPLDTTMRLLESLLLVRAASTIAQSAPAFTPALARWLVAGAGTACALTLVRMWEGARRLESPVTTFAQYLLNVRLNVHYADLNAAGSYFVMAVGVAAGLAWLRPRRWTAPLLLALIGLWVSGSRAAMAAGVVAATLPAGWSVLRLQPRRLRGLAVGAVLALLVLVAAGFASLVPERGNQRHWSVALLVRWEFVRTSMRMLASDPLFGVGVGRYYQRTEEFSSPELISLFPPARNENAHNNFLQLLAELGVTGFAALVWVLFTAGRQIARALRSDSRNPLRWGILAGLVAFVLSSLAGHPLLIDEPAFSFWLLLGAACGWGIVHTVRTPRPYATWTLAAVLVLIAASVPARAHRERGETRLEHSGIGLSPWQDSGEGMRYRLAGVASSVFIPSEGPRIAIPLRAAKPGDALRVELRLDGHPANVIDVPADRWYDFRLLLPPKGGRPRYHRLDFRVVNGSPMDSDLLKIGKVESR